MLSSVPLNQRIVRSYTVASTLTQRSSGLPLRSRPPKLWTNENMQNAVAAVEKGEDSIRRAAEKYDIPRSTLHDHVSGKIQHGAKPGRDPYLTIEEEEELINFLLNCAQIGYPHTRKQMLSLVQEIVDQKGLKANISSGWWERFTQRNPRISLRIAAPLSHVRAMASDRESLNCYFDVLERTLKENEIFNNPTRIFNCDETGMPLGPSSPKVVAQAGAKNPIYPTGSSKVQVTVLACTSASGYALPPFVLFNRKSLNPELTKGEVPGTLYGLSDSGWMNTELFSSWFFDHFLPNAPSARPLLLLLDGHTSHYSLSMIKKAAAEQVVIFVLPPNTTHLTQPLDKGCFSPLKSHWKQVCQAFTAKNCGRIVTLYDFSSLFAEAWYKGMSAKNVLAGFKTCGIYPFNRDVFDLPDESYTAFKPERLLEISGLKFIPMHSPMQRATTLCSSSMKACSTPFAHSTKACQEPSLLDCSKLDSVLLDESFTSNEAVPSQTLLNDSDCTVSIRRTTGLSDLLKLPSPSKKMHKPKFSGNVLTSLTSIKLREEKENKKAMEIEKKEMRRKLRVEQKNSKATRPKPTKGNSNQVSKSGIAIIPVL